MSQQLNKYIEHHQPTIQYVTQISNFQYFELYCFTYFHHAPAVYDKWWHQPALTNILFINQASTVWTETALSKKYLKQPN